jgi:hypothetical protein
MVLLAGCKVDTTVTVVVKENGSGEVRVRAVLDAAAVGAAVSNGGKLEDRVRLGDLTSAGWKVTPWTRGRDGSATLALVKPFLNVSQVNAIIRELNGADGPLRDVHVTRQERIGAINFAFRGTADLAAMKTGVLADPALVASLTAQQVNVRAIDQRLLGQLRDGFTLHVRADLPERVSTWSPRPGTRLVMRSSSSVTNQTQLAWIIIGAGIAVFAVLFLVVGELRATRRRRARRAVGRR